MSTSIPASIPGSSAPDIPAYEGDSDRLAKAWQAAAQGNYTDALACMSTMEAGHSAREIDRLTEISKWFSPMESAADSLLADLNAVTEDRSIELTERQRTYIREAWLQMAQKEDAEPASPEVEQAKAKLLRGDELNQEEAKRLYSHLTEAKEFVIPAEFRMETMSSQIKTADEDYKTQQDRAVRTFDMWNPL